MGGFEQHRIQAVVLEKALVINRELRRGVNGDDRRAAIQIDCIVIVLHFAFMRLANRNRLRRFQTREELGRIELQLPFGAFVIVSSFDCRHVARELRRFA